MVHKNLKIEITVKANIPLTSGYRSLVFQRPQNFTFESGDWIDIEVPGETLKGGKTYSLSSSPTEPDLMITFKDGYSELKERLAASQAGDRFIIAQYGNDYKFTLNPNRPSILIAGGVGVAPFRSMLKEMYDLHSKNEVELIYLNKANDFLFQDELSMWQNEIPNLSITYIVTSELNRKKRNKLLLSATKSTNRSFYIAGPEGMVENTEHLLLDFGVDIKDIKIDSFGGY